MCTLSKSLNFNNYIYVAKTLAEDIDHQHSHVGMAYATTCRRVYSFPIEGYGLIAYVCEGSIRTYICTGALCMCLSACVVIHLPGTTHLA